MNDKKALKSNTTARRSVKNATAREMLGIAGFSKRISETQPNSFQDHDAVAANRKCYSRIAAGEASIAAAK